METGSRALRIYRLVFGSVFTVFGLWASARVMLQLQSVNAAWPEWLFLLFPAAPLALGVLVLVMAVHNPPVQRPFLRQRTGAARVFGSTTAAFLIISAILRRLFQQTTLHGVLYELSAAALAVGLWALIFGAINADLRDQELQSQK